MPKNVITDPQRRCLEMLAAGGLVKCYMSDNNRGICYESDEDGFRATLYLTTTIRALRRKSLVFCRIGHPVRITKEGLEILKRG